jgi:hypothetical protein
MCSEFRLQAVSARFRPKAGLQTGVFKQPDHRSGRCYSIPAPNGFEQEQTEGAEKELSVASAASCTSPLRNR